MDKMNEDNVVKTVRTDFLVQMTKTVKKLAKQYRLNSDTILNIITNNLPDIPQENLNDRPINNVSGYRNITQYRTNRWRVNICYNNKRKNLGNHHKTQKEALDILNDYIIKHNLPKDRLQEYYGELVILNKEQEKAQRLYEEQNWNKHILHPIQNFKEK